MSEWWTYRIGSFVLFSARTYERLIEAYNRELWPLQAVVLFTALSAMVWLLRAPSARRDRVVFAGLAAAWATVAWAFEHRRFAAINWAADYVALLFAAQAAGLLWQALRGRVALRRDAGADTVALAIAAIGLLAYPSLKWALDRPLAQAEVFAFMPAPTALATLGCLLLAKPLPTALLAMPLAACAFEGALLWALHAREWWLAPALALLSLACWWTGRRRRT